MYFSHRCLVSTQHQTYTYWDALIMYAQREVEKVFVWNNVRSVRLFVCPSLRWKVARCCATVMFWQEIGCPHCAWSKMAPIKEGNSSDKQKQCAFCIPVFGDLPMMYLEHWIQKPPKIIIVTDVTISTLRLFVTSLRNNPLRACELAYM